MGQCIPGDDRQYYQGGIPRDQNLEDNTFPKAVEESADGGTTELELQERRELRSLANESNFYDGQSGCTLKFKRIVYSWMKTFRLVVLIGGIFEIYGGITVKYH